jgi:Flp pilus assembly protein TadD
MRTFSVTLAGLAGMAAVMLAAQPAQTQMKVFGAGLATTCSQLALEGDYTMSTVQTCTRALDVDTLDRESTAKTFMNRGVVLLRRNSLSSANKDFDRAQSLMPELAEIYVNRAVVLIKQGAWTDAVSQLDRAIELMPMEPEIAYYNRALAREQLDDLVGAYRDFQTAIRLNPDWDRPRTELQRYTVAVREG